MNRSLPIALVLRGPSLKAKISPGLSCNVEYLDLGDRPVGVPVNIEVYIHNLGATRIRGNKLNISFDRNFFALDYLELEAFALESSELLQKPLTIIPRKLTDWQKRITFILTNDNLNHSNRIRRDLKVRSIFDPTKSPLKGAVLGKWKYSSQTAFVWRGDADWCIPASRQTAKRNKHGLEHSIALMRRYHIPSTLAISGRLGLCQSEWLQYVKHYNYPYEESEIDLFIRKLNSSFSFHYQLEYPSITDNRTAIELANHMYLHYYNEFSACADNNWLEGATPNQFRYPWERSNPKTSLSEQRDNCTRNQELVKSILNFEPKSYASPYNGSDPYTANAIEEAGISASSAATSGYQSPDQYPWWHHMPVVPQVSQAIGISRSFRDPFHPSGCEHLVECGYVEGDPLRVTDYLRLMLILRAALNRGSHVVLLTHHQRLGVAEIRMYFERFIRNLVQHSASAVWVTSLFSLGDWWERIRCPKHKSISLDARSNENKIVVRNGSSRIDGVPIIASFEHGKTCAFVVDLDEMASTVKVAED